MRWKHLFLFRYPKLELLIVMIILAYILFSNSYIQQHIPELDGLGYIEIFIAGFLFSFGFLAPFAAGFFITLNPENIWLAAIIGGLGGVISDLLVFKIANISFRDEFRRIEKTKMMKEFNALINKNLGHTIRTYLKYTFVGFLIASPLPDEEAMIILAATKIKMWTIALLSFILHTIGIIILLSI